MGQLLKKTVLVVEDEPLFAAYLDRILQDAGYFVLGPHSEGISALTNLEKPELKVDCAILDFSLSRGETSFGVAMELKRRMIPCMFITGNAARIRAEFDLPGAVRILQKPVRSFIILDQVARLVD